MIELTSYISGEVVIVNRKHITFISAEYDDEAEKDYSHVVTLGTGSVNVRESIEEILKKISEG